VVTADQNASVTTVSRSLPNQPQQAQAQHQQDQPAAGWPDGHWELALFPSSGVTGRVAVAVSSEFPYGRLLRMS
jgi:hypothetical protein